MQIVQFDLINVHARDGTKHVKDTKDASTIVFPVRQAHDNGSHTVWWPRESQEDWGSMSALPLTKYANLVM